MRRETEAFQGARAHEDLEEMRYIYVHDDSMTQ